MCITSGKAGARMADSVASICAMLAIELGLFAAIIFAVFAVDDLVMDGVWIATHQRPKPLPPADSPILRFAVFVPVWGEAAVIGPMLATLCARWPSPDVAVFVGVYPNDPATEAAVREKYAPLREEGHKYVPAPGKNLDWEPNGPNGPAMRFEIGETGRVTAVHAGVPPILHYVEGCA